MFIKKASWPTVLFIPLPTVSSAQERQTNPQLIYNQTVSKIKLLLPFWSLLIWVTLPSIYSKFSFHFKRVLLSLLFYVLRVLLISQGSFEIFSDMGVYKALEFEVGFAYFWFPVILFGSICFGLCDSCISFCFWVYTFDQYQSFTSIKSFSFLFNMMRLMFSLGYGLVYIWVLLIISFLGVNLTWLWDIFLLVVM